jgi:hypothetical protein
MLLRHLEASDDTLIQLSVSRVLSFTAAGITMVETLKQ